VGRAVSISPDGRRAVSGSKGSTVRVWDLETGECEQVLEGHTDWVEAVSITPDGRRAVWEVRIAPSGCRTLRQAV
jgi:WD40 repeat protein